MATDTYPFSLDFQRKLLKLMLGNYQLILSDRLVDARHFEDPIDSILAGVITSLYDAHKSPPSRAMIVEEVRRSYPKEQRGLIRKTLSQALLEDVTQAECSFIVQDLRRFVGLQSLKIALQDCIDPLREGDLEKARSIVKDSLSAGDQETLPEVFYFRDVGQRMRGDAKDIRHRPLRTLIAELDLQLRRGGMFPGELGVILAISNVGKTMALCHLAKAAIIQREQVVYFSLDDPPDLIAERLDASFSGVELKNLVDRRSDVIAKVRRLHKMYGDSLIIKEGLPGQSLAQMDAYIDKLNAQGFAPRLAIVDFVNQVGSDVESRRERNRPKELGDIYQGLKRWAKLRRMVVWTASQAHRAAMGKELTTMGQIAESFESVWHANVIVSLNRTAEEEKREALRLFLAKNKSSISGVTIPIFTNFKKGAFYRKRTTV